MTDHQTYRRLSFVAILVLVLLNLATLSYLMYSGRSQDGRGRGPEDGSRSVKEFIEEELGFDDAQKQAFAKERQVHFESTRAIHREISDLRKEFFAQLEAGVPSDSVANLSELMGQKHAEVEMQTYRHFEQIRELCNTPAQREKFDNIVHEVLRRFAPKKGPKGPPGNRRPPHMRDGPPPPRR